MPVETASDRAAFVNTDEFGVRATFTGLPGAPTADGIFDDEAAVAATAYGPGVQSSNPVFECRTADLPAGLKDGTLVRIGGADYKARVPEHDGTGMTVLPLELVKTA